MNIKKTLNIVLSVLIAICLWSYVIYTVEPSQAKTFYDIPVTLENAEVLAERGLAVSDSDSITIDVKVKGQRQVVSAMNNDDITATADVSECVEGDNVVEVNLEFKKSVTLVSDVTLTVHINVEELVTESRNVIVTYSGDSENISYELKSSSTVDVTGAKSTVAEVAQVDAVVTEEDLPESDDEEISVDLVPVNGSSKRVKNVLLSETKATVRISATGTVKVPLSVETTGSPADGYEFDGIDAPATVEIKGSTAALEKVTEITCDDIDLSGLTGDTTVELDPNLPDDVAIAGDGKLTATVYISKEGKKNSISISTDDISIKNLGSGLTAQVGSDSITATSSRKISTSDVKLSVDLSGLTAGTHRVKIDVTADDGIDVVLSETSVTVTITGE